MKASRMMSCGQIDNWQREGDWADNWAFVGVIDTDGFLSAELRELRGKDFQQVLLFTDDFTIQRSAVSASPGDFDSDGDVDGADFLMWQQGETSDSHRAEDLADWQANFGAAALPAATSTAVPEPTTGVLLMLGIVTILYSARVKRKWAILGLNQ